MVPTPTAADARRQRRVVVFMSFSWWDVTSSEYGLSVCRDDDVVPAHASTNRGLVTADYRTLIAPSGDVIA